MSSKKIEEKNRKGGTPTVDEQVDNFFEGFDEDSFIADLKIVSAWEGGEEKSTMAEDDKTKEETVVSTASPIRIRPSSGPTPPVSPVPKQEKVKPKRVFNEESALDKFKSFLPDVMKGPSWNSKTHKIPVIKRRGTPTKLGARRDPDKTKRDIERDKMNKNKETLIKKMETGLIPPGMEMETENAQVEEKIIPNVSRERPLISPSRYRPVENVKRRSPPFRARSPCSGERRRHSPSSRTPTLSPNRDFRHRRNRFGHYDKDRFRRTRSRSRSRHARYYSPDRRVRRFSRERTAEHRKLRLSTEKKLRDILMEVKASASSVTPDVNAPYVAHNAPILPSDNFCATYPPPSYTTEAQNYNYQVNPPPVMVPPPQNLAMPSSDYYSTVSAPVYDAVYNTDIPPPVEYSGGYSTDNVYQNVPVNATYQNAPFDSDAMPHGNTMTTAMTSDVFSGAYTDVLEKEKVIRDCEKVVAELKMPHLPTNVSLQNNNIPHSENSVNINSVNYLSPLNRDSTVNYKFTSTKSINEVLLVPSIISTIENKAGITMSKTEVPITKRDVSVQTSGFQCDTCHLKNSFRLEHKGVQTIHRTFLKSVHTQSTEEDMANSKSVFTPHQNTALEVPEPVSLTHMTPAQILVAELKAKTKMMQRNTIDNYRQSGGAFDDVPKRFPGGDNMNNSYGYNRNPKPSLGSYQPNISKKNKNKNKNW